MSETTADPGTWIRGITIRQPWTTCILAGKDVENRSAPWSWRGLVLLHAGQATERAPMRDPLVARDPRPHPAHPGRHRRRPPHRLPPGCRRHRPLLEVGAGRRVPPRPRRRPGARASHPVAERTARAMAPAAGPRGPSPPPAPPPRSGGHLMNGNRTGVPQPPTFIAADDRIPFPDTDQALRCRTSPDLFAIEDIHNTDKDPRAREKVLAQAKHACSGCPIVKDCLKWALANPGLTKTGVWAATTKRDRKQLRKQLVARLGEDWVGVVAEQDRLRRERQRAARVVRRPPATLPSPGWSWSPSPPGPRRTTAGSSRSPPHRPRPTGTCWPWSPAARPRDVHRLDRSPRGRSAAPGPEPGAAARRRGPHHRPQLPRQGRPRAAPGRPRAAHRHPHRPAPPHPGNRRRTHHDEHPHRPGPVRARGHGDLHAQQRRLRAGHPRGHRPERDRAQRPHRRPGPRAAPRGRRRPGHRRPRRCAARLQRASGAARLGGRAPGRLGAQPRRTHHRRPVRAVRAPRQRGRAARGRSEGRQGPRRTGEGAGGTAHREGRHPHHHGGRAPTPIRAGLGSGRSREELAAIRTWARANGHQVADGGMVPKRILAAYDDAHQAPVRKAG